MTKRVRVLSCLMLLALLLTGAGAREGDLASVPPALVTAGLLQARLTETESDPALDGETRGKLLALYRKALSNLEEVATHQTRADAFEEATRSAPEQTRRILERIHGAKAADRPELISFSTDTPLDQIEQRLKREEADRAAADAQRAELDRQLAYQGNRPAAIRQRLAAAQEEQDAIAAALQAELAGDLGSALVQARRWSQETRYIALSTETQALDQELLSLPMRLDLLAARRAEELTKNHRIEQRVEALQALVNARREVEANEAEAAALRMLQATAGLDPGLARLAEQNVALTAALGSLVAQGDRLDAEQQAADRLAARTQASFERAQTAKAVGVSTDGLGQLLLEQHVALPDPDAYGRMAGALAGRIAAVNLSRLRHLEEAERLADPAGTAGETGAPALPADAAASRALWHDLMEQRRVLLDRQLEAEGQYLERLRKLQTAEVQALEAVRAYDDFLVEQLFWLPTGARTRLADLAKLPEELRLLLLPGPWLNLARTLGDQVAASPVLWLALLSSALLVWKRRRLIAAIKQTSVPLAKPGTDGFGHTLRALLLTLALAAPWPLLLGATGWLLLAAPQGTTLSLAFGASLVRIALVLYAPWRCAQSVCQAGWQWRTSAGTRPMSGGSALSCVG